MTPSTPQDKKNQDNKDRDAATNIKTQELLQSTIQGMAEMQKKLDDQAEVIESLRDVNKNNEEKLKELDFAADKGKIFDYQLKHRGKLIERYTVAEFKGRAVVAYCTEEDTIRRTPDGYPIATQTTRLTMVNPDFDEENKESKRYIEEVVSQADFGEQKKRIVYELVSKTTEPLPDGTTKTLYKIRHKENGSILIMDPVFLN